jgi:hypothetical protein
MSTFLRLKRLQSAGHVVWTVDLRIPKSSGRIFRWEKVCGKVLRGRLEDIVLRNAADLLQIRSWKAAARIKESWRKEFGEAMVRKLAEAP